MEAPKGSRIQIPTDDGVVDAYVARPAGGPWPGVLYFMDGIGWRPTLFRSKPFLRRS